MHVEFEEIISGFLEKRVGISNEFLSVGLASQLTLIVEDLYKNEALKMAGVGNNDLLSINKKIRMDKIFWLDKKDNKPYETVFFELIDSFVSYLNSSCYANIKSYEFHYALYEKGAFYKRHLDQFKSDNKRAYTMIMYLNKAWQKNDGGELKVYLESGIQLISPENQKCIFFKSDELAHEVLLTNVSRMSITGWLKN